VSVEIYIADNKPMPQTQLDHPAIASLKNTPQPPLRSGIDKLKATSHVKLLFIPGSLFAAPPLLFRHLDRTHFELLRKLRRTLFIP
jgi:hypothetical protein